ncbi:MAG: phosphate ABC transporter substrate-binding protein PstS [Caulobacteraceae bacterium]|nr:phosphate ABC transporter substrate-binding protein PstS [Caulobacter sp.]
MTKTITAALAATMLAGATAAAAADISGAGATAPAPVYQRWAADYGKTSGVHLNYQPIGSGGGIKQIYAKTVEFGASDKPLPAADLAGHGLVQFPTVIVGIVPVVNLPGIAPGQLKLNGSVLADIYLGEIKKWNDPRIMGLNKGLKVPGLPITVVHRSDGSGTTFLYTSYLNQVAPQWRKVGASDSVNWPVGQGGKGNDGVSAFVRQTPGSIGYVEYAYAKLNKLAFADMLNHDNKVVAPTAPAFAQAASHAQFTPANNFAPSLLDQPGAGSWPIAGATFILMYKDQPNAAAGADVLKFFDWAYKNGDAAANELAYVPLPAGVKASVRRAAWSQVRSGGKPVYTGK